MHTTNTCPKKNFITHTLFILSLLFCLNGHILASEASPTHQNKKLLLVSDTWGQIGGAEAVIAQVIPELKQREFEIYHMDLCDVKSFKAPYPGVRTTKPHRARRAFIKKLAEIKPDYIIIVFLGVLSYAAGNYCFEKKIPFNLFYPSRIPEIIKKHFHVPHWLSYHFVDKLLRRASTVLVPSESLKQNLEKRKLKNIIAWPHGIELEKFSLPTALQKKEAIQKCNLENRPHPFYLYVGRLSKAKNIDAFLKLKVQGTKILVGPEDFGYKIKHLKKQYRDIVFAGPQRGQDLLNYYHASDVFIFPSKTDTFGLVLLEALACGLPVVAFNEIGPRDIITPESGIGYLAHSKKELKAHAVRAWDAVQNGIITPEMCRAHAAQFTWNTAVDVLLANMKRCT